VSGQNIQGSACTLRAFKKECVKEIPVFNGMHASFPPWLRGQVIGSLKVPVFTHPRKFWEVEIQCRNRMVRSFIDLLAVKWMKHRTIRYDIEEKI